MSRRHGPIMGVKLLGKFTVVLSSHEAIREAFVKHGYDFAGRPNNDAIHTFSCGTGTCIKFITDMICIKASSIV